MSANKPAFDACRLPSPPIALAPSKSYAVSGPTPLHEFATLCGNVAATSLVQRLPTIVFHRPSETHIFAGVHEARRARAVCGERWLSKYHGIHRGAFVFARSRVVSVFANKSHRVPTWAQRCSASMSMTSSIRANQHASSPFLRSVVGGVFFMRSS